MQGAIVNCYKAGLRMQDAIVNRYEAGLRMQDGVTTAYNSILCFPNMGLGARYSGRYIAGLSPHSHPLMFRPFLKNPFLSPRLNREDFRELMEGHLSRLSSQNQQGRYDALITALQPHHDAYAALLAEQSENVGSRLGSTDTVEGLLADFKKFAKDELLVDAEYQFKRKTPNAQALAEFLPKGRKEYNNASIQTLPTLLERTASLTQKYKAELGKPLADRAAALNTAFKAARGTQGESKGTVQDDSKQEKKLRKAAARQLKLGLLEQLRLHIDEPDAVPALYDAKWFPQKGK